MSAKNDKLLCEIIRSGRKEKKFTQAELAKLTGVSQSAIALLESGQRAVSHEIIEKILDILGKKNDITILTKSSIYGICVNPACMHNQRLLLNGHKLILPTLVKHPGNFCKHCHSDICLKCHNCSEPIPGDIAIYCETCGEAWITTELLGDIDAQWVEVLGHKFYLEVLKLSRDTN